MKKSLSKIFLSDFPAGTEFTTGAPVKMDGASYLITGGTALTLTRVPLASGPGSVLKGRAQLQTAENKTMLVGLPRQLQNLAEDVMRPNGLLPHFPPEYVCLHAAMTYSVYRERKFLQVPENMMQNPAKSRHFRFMPYIHAAVVEKQPKITVELGNVNIGRVTKVVRVSYNGRPTTEIEITKKREILFAAITFKNAEDLRAFIEEQILNNDLRADQRRVFPKLNQENFWPTMFGLNMLLRAVGELQQKEIPQLRRMGTGNELQFSDPRVVELYKKVTKSESTLDLNQFMV